MKTGKIYNGLLIVVALAILFSTSIPVETIAAADSFQDDTWKLDYERTNYGPVCKDIKFDYNANARGYRTAIERIVVPWLEVEGERTVLRRAMGSGPVYAEENGAATFTTEYDVDLNDADGDTEHVTVKYYFYKRDSGGNQLGPWDIQLKIQVDDLHGSCHGYFPFWIDPAPDLQDGSNMQGVTKADGSGNWEPFHEEENFEVIYSQSDFVEHNGKDYHTKVSEEGYEEPGMEIWFPYHFSNGCYAGDSYEQYCEYGQNENDAHLDYQDHPDQYNDGDRIFLRDVGIWQCDNWAISDTPGGETVISKVYIDIYFNDGSTSP